jgi:tight adherence protein C
MTLRACFLDLVQRLGRLVLPRNGEQQAPIQVRFHHAGFYNAQAPAYFLGARIALFVLLPVMVLIPLQAGWLSSKLNAPLLLCAAGLGLAGPGLWLDSRTKRRKDMLRQGLPDVVDMLVLCLEGGISIRSALQRVTSEVQTTHPLLAGELAILQREVQLGLSPGEAMKKFSDRSGLSEVHTLASLLLQSERFGASMGKSLRIHADGFRLERQQAAEEMAQKATVKILFPTLLCIFPAIFIVILGPAAMQIAAMFSGN